METMGKIGKSMADGLWALMGYSGTGMTVTRSGMKVYSNKICALGVE